MYFIGYSDKVIRLLVLIMPKAIYVKTIKVKDRDKDENNKLMSFRIDDEKKKIKLFGLRLKI